MLKKYRILLLLGGILSCLFSLNLIYGSRMYFRNMYSDHFVYDFNIYVQIISVALFGVLLLLLLIKKTKPYFYTIVGIITILINVVGMILYSIITEEFYLNIYSFRGIILLLIGVFLQSNNLVFVKRLSLYFFLELLVIQVSSLSEDSIFYMVKTFEVNTLGSMILFLLGLMIPLSMNIFLTDGFVGSSEPTRKPINIKKLMKITSWISIAYLVVLIIMNVPYLFPILADADRMTVLYYQISAILRISLYSLLIFSFICVTRDSVKKWLLPAITITIIVTVIFPLTINIQFYLDRLYWFYGVILDLILLIVMTIFVYIRKYKVSFLLSIWFLLNFLLTPLRLGNLQTMIVFRNIAFRNFEIFVQIIYYFLPITLILVLYNRMIDQKVNGKQLSRSDK
ncbi:MAG: hypothetical protein K9L02_06815 [Acholeplasmataceae bacterium]|nr:hypothetical protein [Acholeplasmataceae bacterium]